MREPIESEYFNWLCAKVKQVDWAKTLYHDLLRILHTTEFVWVVIGDKNRLEDGLELRTYFLAETRSERDEDWYHQPCSVLEVLIAFADRASFQTNMPVRDWFWIFVNNLNLDGYRQVSRSEEPIIDDILQTFIWRTYEPNGHGGLFPMRWPDNDQRKVEIWYQFCEYLNDQGLI